MATLTMESEVLRDLDLAGPLTVSPGLRNSTEIAVSKAGLYVLIQGLLDIRPRFDRTLLQSQLQIRYGLQVERLSSDLIHASLRVLHDAVEQKQPPRVIATYRSFCINTVPVLLRQSQLRAMRFQMDGGMGRAVISAVDRYSQACMMNRLTENLSGGTDELQIDDAFLESCRALGVVQQRDEASYAGAPEKTYGAFQQIVGQRTALIISSDPSHMDTFVVELTKARGTAEALVQGLIEVRSDLLPAECSVLNAIR